MPWFAVYETLTGRLESVGSRLGDVPLTHSVKEFADRPDQGTLWDPALRVFAPRPADVTFDRLHDIANHPYLGDVWTRLTTTQRAKLRKFLVWLLASHRYRPTTELPLDPDPTWPTAPDNVTE